MRHLSRYLPRARVIEHRQNHSRVQMLLPYTDGGAGVEEHRLVNRLLERERSGFEVLLKGLIVLEDEVGTDDAHISRDANERLRRLSGPNHRTGTDLRFDGSRQQNK